MEWNEGAFQSLVLPADQKELVLAFAESQAKYKGTFDDVIQGKGLSSVEMDVHHWCNSLRLCRQGYNHIAEWATRCGQDFDGRIRYVAPGTHQCLALIL